MQVLRERMPRTYSREQVVSSSDFTSRGVRVARVADNLVSISIDLAADESRVPSEVLAGLTAAEQEVMRLAASELSNARIAGLRGVAQSTVANQLTQAFRKLGVAGRRELRALLGIGLSDSRAAGESGPDTP